LENIELISIKEDSFERFKLEIRMRISIHSVA